MFEIHSAHEQQVEVQNLPRPSVHPDSSIKPEENNCFFQFHKKNQVSFKKNGPKKKKSVHWPGIGPGSPAWQARILPLNHQCLHGVKPFNSSVKRCKTKSPHRHVWLHQLLMLEVTLCVHWCFCSRILICHAKRPGSNSQ